MKRVITFGTFDIFHIGHLRILERARALGDHLTVGVSSDKMNHDKKQRYPIYPQDERMRIILGLKCVDEVFLEESLALKGEYIRTHKADVLVMGHDWEGRFDEFRSLCEVVYLPRTQGVSTTDIINQVKTYA
ncbi:MAG: adenylyltransferase/cytidyltransferase family protein [Proteobacteria bacterium]|nr:adenylyltransferase/cytidyltransferase family protein [Pseudomonadota bacterium]NLN62586.1 adenylyltransferase/cytidyltransferase family protein [Myxococcales bacterium]